MIAATTMTAGTIEQGRQPKTVDDPLLRAAIRAVQGGDARAFEQVMAATERRVALLCWRILGDAEEVKDAAQEVFFRAYRHLGRYDERREFMGWLFRITVNVCRDHLARRKKREQVFTGLGETDPPAAGDLAGALAAKQQLARLTRAIDELPAKERLALILRDVEELPTEQVAEILGSRPATVRVQVSSARAKLRRLMERWR
jgi:RNA polymerase sigma-70 factor, ECF subfamily